MKHPLLVTALAFALAATGCTVSSKYMAPLQSPRAVQTDPGLATVVFVRQTDYAKPAKIIQIDSKGRFLGEGWGETYYAVTMPPGEYTFISVTEGTSAMKATVEAGKIYYVHVDVTMGGWEARARLFALGPQREHWNELPEWLGDCTMLVPNEPGGQAFLSEDPEELQETIQKGLQNLTEYEGEELERRTLVPADGVEQPVASQAKP